MTSFGEALRSDVPGSAWASAILASGEIGQAWDHLADTIRTGVPAFETVIGRDLFSHLADRPELRDTFYASQAADLELTLAQLDFLDFTAYRTVVDVGGGDGALLAHILTRAPSADGVLVDLPSVITWRRLAEFADRCTIVAGDFFASVPEGGDLYLLRDILHDWSDERCLQILANCRHAMPPGADLMIIERVADPAPGPLVALMDLYMLTVVDGRERTLAEYTQLLTSAGFHLADVHTLPAGTSILIASDSKTVGGLA